MSDAGDHSDPAEAEPTRYYCHTCDGEVEVTLEPTLKCNECGNEFVEELPEEDRIHDEDDVEFMGEDDGEYEDEEDEEDEEDDDQPRRGANPLGGGPFPFPGGGNDFLDIIMRTMMEAQAAQPGGRRGGRRNGGGAGGAGGLNFLHELLGAAQLVPFGNMGDYVFSQREFDNIVSRSLDQAMQNAPPPASAASLDKLPRREPTQADVDAKLDCAVCKEDLTLQAGTLVDLPCKHIFHEDCVVKWLKEHGTCPVCRKRVDDSAGASAGQSQTEPIDLDLD